MRRKKNPIKILIGFFLFNRNGIKWGSIEYQLKFFTKIMSMSIFLARILHVKRRKMNSKYAIMTFIGKGEDKR